MNTVDVGILRIETEFYFLPRKCNFKLLERIIKNDIYTSRLILAGIFIFFSIKIFRIIACCSYNMSKYDLQSRVIFKKCDNGLSWLSKM